MVGLIKVSNTRFRGQTEVAITLLGFCCLVFNVCDAREVTSEVRKMDDDV